ncbi:MAG: TAT-variant-translocated molybdopterin oxidoreductase [Planctomycetota bacterium]
MSDAPTRGTMAAASTDSSQSPDVGYWRSLDQLAGGADYQRWLSQEFEDGADLPPDAVSRRRFLGVVAASVALAGMTSCRKPLTRILPFAKRPAGLVPGRGEYYASAHLCGGYGVGSLVTSHDGRPTMVAGNPEHPMSLGGSSVAMIADLLNLYDPARSRAARGPETPAGAHEGEHGGEPHAAGGLATFLASWQPQLAALGTARGKGLAILVEPSTSPTLGAMLRRVHDQLPEAKLHVWTPVNRDQEVAGAKLAFGQALDAHYDVKQANVVACFDHDLLASGPAALAYARAWGDRRRAPSTGGDMPRLYVAEPCFTPTGSLADHRFRLRACEVGPALFALGAALLELGASGIGDDVANALRAHKDTGFQSRGKNWIPVLAKDLWASKGRAFVCVGPRQPAAVHAAAHAINTMLGSVGSVVQFTATPPGLAFDQLASLRELTTAMAAGEVRALVCLGANPVYNAPADFGFADKLAKVPFSVHLGLHQDETARHATWHVHQAHDLETWGDALAWDGTATIMQPLVMPLYGGVSAAEFLAHLIEHSTVSGHELVRETWRPRSQAGDGFDRWWDRAVHDGVVGGSATPRVGVPALRGSDIGRAVSSIGKPAPGSASALEVAFQAHASVDDGRNANNAWAQELPHPTTKLTWDNAALMSLATARALDVTLGDLIELTVGDRKLELPVWVAPGHADWSVTLELGFGRELTPEHRVAQGAGFDAYKVRGSDGLSFALGAAARKTGGTYPMATTQDHGTIEGRALYREQTVAGYKADPGFAPAMSPLAKQAQLQGRTEVDLAKSLWEERDYKGPYQWGMSIDLNGCTGCNACVLACVAENNVPVVGKPQVRKGREMHWLRIDRYFTAPVGQDDPGSVGNVEDSKTIAAAAEPQMVAQPVPCMQCENAPCESVCPVAATTHGPEGLNDMVYNRCIGTRYCSNNCPYKVRRFNFFDFTGNKSTPEKMAMNPDVTVRSRGVMEKCTYCVQRIEGARNVAKREKRSIRDGDVVTACAQACPTQAITFGNISDKESRVSRLKAHALSYAMLSELNVKPRTTYVARIRNPHPELV